jgi:calcium binding protein 39
MAMFFGLGRNRQKTPVELAHETKDLTIRLAQDDKLNPKVRSPNARAWVDVADQAQIEEALALDLQQMKIRLQGTPGMVHVLLPFLRNKCADMTKTQKYPQNMS